MELGESLYFLDSLRGDLGGVGAKRDRYNIGVVIVLFYAYVHEVFPPENEAGWLSERSQAKRQLAADALGRTEY